MCFEKVKRRHPKKKRCVQEIDTTVLNNPKRGRRRKIETKKRKTRIQEMNKNDPKESTIYTVFCFLACAPKIVAGPEVAWRVLLFCV
jgi:hypothetical protein